MRLDLTSGKVVEACIPASKSATARQYAGPNFVLIDNRQIIELESKRIVWNLIGGVHAVGNPDGLHWAAPRSIAQSGILTSLQLPAPELPRLIAAEAKPNSRALLRSGITVSLQVEGTPPRDGDGFRAKVISSLNAQLGRIGATSGTGGPVDVDCQLC